MTSERDDIDTTSSDSDERVEAILRKARLETSAKDTIGFAFGKAWSVLLIVGSVAVVFFEKWMKSEHQRTKDRDQE